MGGWPEFDDEQIDAVAEILRSGRINYWTGEKTRAFERAYAEAAGVGHAVALMNGTVSLELALHAYGIGPGDEVVVTPRSFVASASCVVLAGAVPVFADIDPDSQNITAETIEAVLTPRTRAIIPVHLAGWPCDMDPIMKLARHHDLKVIEDCAQAHGATYKGRPVGSLAHAASFSFCQDKIVTTGGEGGMLLTDDREIWKKAWSHKDHGKNYDAVHHQDHPPGFRWLHDDVGTNWRMTEMQAAIGLIQLARLPSWVARRRMIAGQLNDCCEAHPALRVTRPPSSIDHAYYRHYVFVRPERLASDWSRDRVMTAVAARGVPCFSGSCGEIYREKAFSRFGLEDLRLPVARELGETSLAFLTHPTLEDREVDEACQVIDEVITAATR